MLQGLPLSGNSSTTTSDAEVRPASLRGGGLGSSIAVQHLCTCHSLFARASVSFAIIATEFSSSWFAAFCFTDPAQVCCGDCHSSFDPHAGSAGTASGAHRLRGCALQPRRHQAARGKLAGRPLRGSCHAIPGVHVQLYCDLCLSCFPISQAERDIRRLEEAGESAAATALRRKVERPSLSGKSCRGKLWSCLVHNAVLPAAVASY